MTARHVLAARVHSNLPCYQ